MSRIRTIKPDFWEDETIGILSRDARLLFIACFNLADDEGRLRWSPAYIKSSVFMYDDDLDTARVKQIMSELTDLGLMRAYTAGKAPQALAVVVNFLKHQRINRPQASKFPTPDWEADPSLNDSVNDSVNDAPTLPVSFSDGREGKGREEEGKRKGSGGSVGRAVALPADFTPSDDMKAWATSKSTRIDLALETEKFRNWHQSKGSKYKDWNATWRNWILKAIEFAQANPTSSTQQKEWWHH